MRFSFCAIFGLLFALAPAALAEDASFIHMRGGLNNSFQRFAASQKTQAYTKISYFGGSITAGAGASKPANCWRELLHGYLREQFPGASLAENNASLGGTGSWLGAFRTKNQALYGGAALVIVEFAVNDGGQPQEKVIASMEGIVRQIWRTDPTTDILFVYTLARNHLPAYKAGKLPREVEWHEQVAEHYGIPSVNMAAYAYQKLAAGELTFDQFTKDGVHPTDHGYQLYFDALKVFVAQCKDAALHAGPIKPHAFPKPISVAPMENARCIPYEWATLSGDWKPGRKSPVDSFLDVMEGGSAGDSLEFKFIGAQCGLFNTIGPDTGDLEVSVDGGAWQPKPDWDKYGLKFTRAHARVLAEGLDPRQLHDVTVRIAQKQPAQSKGRFQRIGYLLVDGWTGDPLATLDTLGRMDAVWKKMELPLKMPLASDRFASIPLTMKRLRDGGELNVVLLGDSIIGDTGASNFDLLLQRDYPKCKIDKTVSVRGSTGCWWYKDDNRVQDYVLKHKPDLLVIGGISQRNDIDSIRAVIDQVRAKQPCEVLLMTPAFGATTDAHIRNWQFDIDAKADPYRAGLRQLAAEKKCAFIDMTGPWWQFIKDSGDAYGYFQRDRVHSNDRGKQILARIIEKWFAPAAAAR